MPINWGYVWVVLVSIGLVISLMLGIRENHWLIDNSSMIWGWVLLLFQTSYVNIEKVYWFMQRIKYHILNPDTVWDLSIKYKTDGVNEKAITKAAAGTV